MHVYRRLYLLSGMCTRQMHSSWKRVLDWRKKAWREELYESSSLAVCIYNSSSDEKSTFTKVRAPTNAEASLPPFLPTHIYLSIRTMGHNP